MTDRLAGISVFVEAVEAGGFSAAAARLNLSRSAVGKTIARLEQRLGVRLFHRTTRSQSLTNDGQAFYERCLKALEEVQAAETMLESGRKEIAGRLRVSMPVLFGRRCVAPILLDLAREHSGLELDLSFNDRMIDLVEDGFDLGVRNGALVDSAALIVRRVAYQQMTVCAAPSYLERFGVPRGPEDFSAHHAVVYGRGERIRTWLFPQDAGQPLEATPPARLRFDDLEVIADAVADGFGLGWLPCWLIRERVQAGTLVRLCEHHQGMIYPVSAVWPHNPHLPLRVRLTIDALAARLPTLVEM